MAGRRRFAKPQPAARASTVRPAAKYSQKPGSFESSQRTMTTIRRSGSIQVNELPAPIALLEAHQATGKPESLIR